MILICDGVSFHNASLAQREPFAFTEQQQSRFLQILRQTKGIHEAFVLCTCNRTEFYLYVEDGLEYESSLASVIHSFTQCDDADWSGLRTVRTSMDAVRHLFSVASGLDSQMLGESQIINQLKQAYSTAIEARTAKFFFHRLMHCAFRASKDVRTNTEINVGSISVSVAAVQLAGGKLNLPGANVLLLGAGQNTELFARQAIKAGVSQLTICSRTLESASELAARLKMGQAGTLNDVQEHIGLADMIFCSTASEKPLVTTADYGYLLSQREKPLVIVDVAVPRDVEPAVNELENVYVYNIEDLDQQVKSNLQKRSQHLPAALKIIDTHTAAFDQWYKGLDVTDVVSSLSDTYLDLARSEAQRYQKLFPDLNPDELTCFAESLVKKVLHGPISYLKDSSDDELASDQLQATELVKKILLTEDGKRGEN